MAAVRGSQEASVECKEVSLKKLLLGTAAFDDVSPSAEILLTSSSLQVTQGNYRGYEYLIISLTTFTGTSF